MMVDFQMVRYTFAAVILVTVYVQCISCTPAYIGHERRISDQSTTYGDGDTNDIPRLEVSRSRNAIGDRVHKHLKFIKAPDPRVVETVIKRLKSRMKGRKPDQSNERNLWTSHPKKEDYLGPDTDEVIEVIPYLGI